MEKNKINLNEQYVGREERTVEDITSNVVILLRCRMKSRLAEDYAAANVEPDESPEVTQEAINELIDEYMDFLETGCEIEEDDHTLEAFVIGGYYVQNVLDAVSNGAFYRTFKDGRSDAEGILDAMDVNVLRFPHHQDELARKILVVKAQGKYEFEQKRDKLNEHRAPMSEAMFKIRQRQGLY